MLYYGSKLSANIQKREPEGYLYCLNVPIARIGSQPYMASELGLEGDKVVQVIRTPEEVFDPAAIASFEGMPICNDHPYDAVSVDNVSAYEKGHVQNVRRGQPPEDDLLVADLVITHSDLIDEVLGGKREISCGYTCDYVMDDNGKVYQRAIRGNHVAVVADGRAGSRVAIRDSAHDIICGGKRTMKTPSLFARAVARFVQDADPEEAAQAIDEMMVNEPEQQDAFPAAPATPPMAAPAAPAPAAPVAPAPAAPQKDEESDLAGAMAKLIEMMSEIKAAVCKPAAPAPGSLDALENELQGKAPTAPVPAPKDEDPFEEEKPETADEFPAEEKPEETVDEEPEEEPTMDGCGGYSTNDALLSVLKDMRRTVATLPEEQRKVMSDSMNKAIRKAAGIKQGDGKKKLARIAAGKTADSAPVDDGELGRKLMEKYNPHYKK